VRRLASDEDGGEKGVRKNFLESAAKLNQYTTEASAEGVESLTRAHGHAHQLLVKSKASFQGSRLVLANQECPSLLRVTGAHDALSVQEHQVLVGDGLNECAPNLGLLRGSGNAVTVAGIILVLDIL
jgi:hypothetical protein